MARRNSPNDIQDLGDLSRLGDIVIDKRRGQRAAAKRNRRNRHYENQLIRNTLTHRPQVAFDDAEAVRADEPIDSAMPVLARATP
jgi:hypothetical protein